MLILVELTVILDANSNLCLLAYSLISNFWVSLLILVHNLFYGVDLVLCWRLRLYVFLSRRFCYPFYDGLLKISEPSSLMGEAHPMGKRCYLVFIFRNSLKNYQRGICYEFLSALTKNLRIFYPLLLLWKTFIRKLADTRRMLMLESKGS